MADGDRCRTHEPKYHTEPAPNRSEVRALDVAITVALLAAAAALVLVAWAVTG